MSEQPVNPFQEQQPNEQPAPQQRQQPQFQPGQIPVELVTLPSQGLIYPPGHPLCNEKAVEIRCMSRKRRRHPHFQSPD